MIKSGRKLREIFHGGRALKGRSQRENRAKRRDKRPWAALLALMILIAPINAEALADKGKDKAAIEKPNKALGAPKKHSSSPAAPLSAGGCTIIGSDLNAILRDPQKLSGTLGVDHNGKDNIVRRKALTITPNLGKTVTLEAKKSVDANISDRSLLALISYMEASKRADIMPATFYQMLLAQEEGASHAAAMVMLPYRQIPLTQPVTLIEGTTPKERLASGLKRARWLIDQYEETRALADILIDTADKTDVPFKYLLGLGAIESSYYPSARAHVGSASGLYQFIDQTWLYMVKTYGQKYGLDKEAQLVAKNIDYKWDVKDSKQKTAILNLRYNAKISAYMAAEYALENGRFMAAHVGISKTIKDFGPTDYYMAHFFGADEAAKFFAAYEKDPSQAAAPIFPAAASHNKGVFYGRKGHEKSLDDVYQFFDHKMFTIIQQYKAAEKGNYGLNFTLPPKPTKKPTPPAPRP